MVKQPYSGKKTSEDTSKTNATEEESSLVWKQSDSRRISRILYNKQAKEVALNCSEQKKSSNQTSPRSLATPESSPVVSNTQTTSQTVLRKSSRVRTAPKPKDTSMDATTLHRLPHNTSGSRAILQLKKKQPKLFATEKILPEINDKAPGKEERQNLSQVEAEPFMCKSSGGFRFFVRKFTDELFKKCLGNPAFDTIEGYSPKILRYIHILRNAWKSLSEGERRNWQNLFNRCFENHSIKSVFDRELTQDDCLEELNISEQQLLDRQWVSSVDTEFLPCLLCAADSMKRYSPPELMAHLSLSHASIRLYACHFCQTAFQSSEAWSSHPNCTPFTSYIEECNERAVEPSFDFAYLCLICAECGLQLAVSPRCFEDSFASTLINCLFSHNSDNMQVLITFSCVELFASPLKLPFSLLEESLTCEVCNEDCIDANQLEEHLQEHKDQLRPTKCPSCPQLFYSQPLLGTHLQEHLNTLPAITQFMPRAILFPAAADRNLVIRVGGTRQPFISPTPAEDNQQSGQKRKSFQRQSIDREDKRNLEKEAGSISSWISSLPSQPLTWKQFNEQNLLNYNKLNSEINLEVVFNEKIGKVLVENPIDGAVLADNVYHCVKCSSLISGDHHTKQHLKDCLGLPSLIEASACFTNKSSEHLVQLFDATNFAFNRISCGLCTSTHCSIIALQKHYALSHFTLCKFIGGKDTIQEYGQSVLRKDWLTSRFDKELLEMIKSSPLPPCKSEFDTFNEDYLTFAQPSIRYIPEGKETDKCSTNLIQSDGDKHAIVSHSTALQNPPIKMEVMDTEFDPRFEPTSNAAANDVKRPVIVAKARFTSPTHSIKVKTEVIGSEECFAPNYNSNPTDHQPIARQVTDGRIYCCFLCAQPQTSTHQLKEHFLSHPENWSKCPICVKQDTWEREDFLDQMDFYKHMKNTHVKVQNNFAYCPFCSFSITASQIQVSVNAMIRHIIFECFGLANESRLCMLCEEKYPYFKNKHLAEEIVSFHRQKAHRLVYDRLICSACKTGFYCRDMFLKHTCEKAFRCECNPSKCFKKASDFYSHIYRSFEEKFTHAEILSIVDVKPADRKIELNQEYEKICKAKLEALKPQTAPEEKQPIKEHIVRRKLRQRAGAPGQPKKPKRRARRRVREDIALEVQKKVTEMVNIVSAGAVHALLSSKPQDGENSMLKYRNSSRALSRQLRRNPVCDLCGQKFKQAFELLQHKRESHGFEDNKFPLPLDVQCYLCAACCLAFQAMDDYVEHMRRHPQLTGCKKCSGVVGTNEDFYLHHPSHSNPQLSIYACSICAIHYDNEFNLLFHMAEQHKTILAYFCKHCRLCSTHGPYIIEHFLKTKCRKLLTIEYLGLCDAAQIKFQPKSSHDYIKKTKMKKIQIVKKAKCYHKCLLARNEPWITCKECNCPIPLSKWRFAFDRNSNLTTKRADDETGIVDPRANYRRMKNLSSMLKVGNKNAEEEFHISQTQVLFSGNTDETYGSMPIQPDTENVSARTQLMHSYPQQAVRQPNQAYLQPTVSNFSVSPRPAIPVRVVPNQNLLTARKYNIPESLPQQLSPFEKKAPEVVQRLPPQRSHFAAAGLHHPDEVEYLHSESSSFMPYDQGAFPPGMHSRYKVMPRVLRRTAAANLDRALFVAKNTDAPQFVRQEVPSTSSFYPHEKRPKYIQLNEPSSGSDEEEHIVFTEDHPPPRKKLITSPALELQRLMPARQRLGPAIVLSPSTCQRRTEATRMPPKPVYSILANEKDIKIKINFMKVMPDTVLYLCATCNHTSSSQLEAVVHQFERHGIKDIKYDINCPKCREHFSDLSVFYAHIAQTPDHLHLPSKWCNFRFYDLSNANKHNVEHEKMQLSQEKQQSCGGIKCCGICGSVREWWITQLPSTRTVIDHSAFHGFATVNVCKICDKTSKKDIQKHFQNSHVCMDFNSKAKYICKSCKLHMHANQLEDHFQKNHMYTLVEFVPVNEHGDLVISAQQELHSRFFPESSKNEC